MSRMALTVRNRILLGASASALSLASSPSQATQTCPASGPCDLTVTEANQTIAIGLAGGQVINTATGTAIDVALPAGASGNGVVIDNRAGASIGSLTFSQGQGQGGGGFQLGRITHNPNLTLINSGAITGNLTLSGNVNTYVADGGTITGSLLAGNFTVDIFVERNPGSPTAFDPGDSIDAYVTSINTSQTVVVPTTLPTNYELNGLEVRGTGTVATVTSAPGGPGHGGLFVYGDGSVINQGTINRPDISGAGFPDFFLDFFHLRAVSYGGVIGATDVIDVGIDPVLGITSLPVNGGLQSFSNQGTINGDLFLITKAFTNTGTINLVASDPGTIVMGMADSNFSFANSGTIALTADGRPLVGRVTYAAVALASNPMSTVPAHVQIDNAATGSISGGLSFAGIASDFVFDNKGTIAIAQNSPITIDRAVDVTVGPWNLSYAVTGVDSLPANSATIINSGTLDGGIEAELQAITASFTNSGTVTRDAGDAQADAVDIETLAFGNNETTDGTSFTFANTGQIGGTVSLDLETTSVDVTNSGTITRDRLPNPPAFFPAMFSGMEIVQETVLNGDLIVRNTGTIATDDFAAGALSVVMEAGDVSSGVAGATNATAHARVDNSGSITAGGGVYVTAGNSIGLPQGSNLFSLSFAVGAGLDAEGASSLEINNSASGVIRNNPGPLVFGTPFGAQDIGQTVTGLGIAATADTITIINDGEVSGGPGSDFRGQTNTNIYAIGATTLDANALEGVIGGAIDTLFSQDTLTNSATGTITGGIALRQGDDSFTNAGTVHGNVYMGSGADGIYNTGLIDGNVDMGDGDDTFAILLAHAAPGGSKGITGTLEGGTGNDLLVFDITGNGALEDMAALHHTGFETTAIGGTGTVSASNLVVTAPINLASGFVTLSAGSTVSTSTPGATAFHGLDGISQDLINQGTINGAVSLGDQTDSVANYGTIDGNIDLGSGDDFFTQGINASLTGTADGGDGFDTFTFDITGGGTIHAAFYDQLVNFEMLGLTGTGAVTFDGPAQVDTIGLEAGAPTVFAAGGTVETQTEVAVTGSTGADDLTNDGTINGDVNLENGDDEFANNGTMNGDVGAGLGDDHVTNNGTINGDVDLDGVGAPDGDGGGGNQQQQFARAFALAAVVVPTGGDDVLDNPGFIGGSVFAGAGNDQFTNSGTVGGDVYMGTGNDHFTLSGGVNGLIDLGDDDDVLELRDGWSIGGLGVLAGTGTDNLRIATTSTYAEPTEIDLGRFSGFETVAVQSGVTAFSNSGVFDTIHVAGGRLIGRTGSEIDADVTVDQGATFGSAGLVRGDIVVNGTLAPGASPGTMTVVGDVQLGATSSTVFEFTPLASDALVIDGTLTIASGASLTLSGTRPLTPGSYVLIDTTGGIEGTFGTNITRDDTVLGVLRQTDDTLELISMFQVGAGANGQVILTNAYLNALLTGGTATTGVLDAFPVLVGGDGFANQAVLATLNPEAYASVAQIGFENGQAIASALRGARVAGPETGSGLFVFGQGFGAWRRFAGQDNGVSRANVRTGGYLGGVGFGNDTFGAAVFVGRSDARQAIPGIAARNEADGMFFGGRVHLAAGGFEAGASVILDRAAADTTRNPATGVAKTDSHYNLHSTTLDGWVGYGFELGQGMKIGPQVGVTHTEVKRDGVTETGGGAFALQVAGQKYKLTTLTADIRASGPVSGKLRGWVEGGVRHRIDGDPITATAAFVGTGTSFTVNGASRAKTTAHFGAGAELTVAKNVDLFVNGDAEAKGGNGAHRIDGGVRIRF